MALTNAEHQRAYRQRQARLASLRKNEHKEILSMILELKEEIASLRKDLTFLRKNPLDSISPPLSLPSSSESTSLKKEGSKREGEQARLARLSAWVPNEEHRQMAYAKGHDDRWLDEQAALYRNHQLNAKIKHKHFDQGFTNWILRSPLFEGRPNGNGTHKQSPAEKLFEGAHRAALAWGERERARLEADEPLLDLRRPPGHPASSD